MNSSEKYKGIFPALYACYDDSGKVSPKRVKALTYNLIDKGVHGLYVGGSSGECIYQSVEERKLVLESVMCEARGKITIISHVACNNTRDSRLLAEHAQKQGVDAISAIPPIYFRLPEYAIERYWNEISSAAPKTDFFIYNIPQLAGVALTVSLLRKMLLNPRVIGIKNSSMPAVDITDFKAEGDGKLTVFNGADEQLVSGLAAGADGGIGGTYGVMLELYVRAYELFISGQIKPAQKLQSRICEIISHMTDCYGSLYAVIKQMLRIRGINIGGVRAPLPDINDDDISRIYSCLDLIDKTKAVYCKDMQV